MVLSVAQAGKNLGSDPGVAAYLKEISQQHGLDHQHLRNLFADVSVQDDVIKLISTPSERTLTWSEYRAIFLTEKRIRGGLEFVEKHRVLLDRAEAQYGVPADIIAAIIGVETAYGQITGNHRALSALATLAFAYPPRASFFRKELTEFLLLAGEEGFDPGQVKGSYAAAMGMPQFISSSYRQYAIDFDNDGRRDLWDSPADVIGSVANYFTAHGWRPGEAIAEKVTPTGGDWLALVTKSLKPTHDDQMLLRSGLKPLHTTPGKKSVMVFERNNQSESWIGHKNFYVITRYNHSRMYAMAVFQLSQILREAGV
ncbi:MAG: lytic murein transglycosylase B [Gammaproteobacteria bacterium]|nr:lytic murein transglycosylase B [Gammaproteobacteria bacterium]